MVEVHQIYQLVLSLRPYSINSLQRAVRPFSNTSAPLQQRFLISPARRSHVFATMNDIDPSKMTEAERTDLFNSFAKDIEPARKPRETIAAKVAPWMAGIVAQRARGLNWKQIAALFDTHLKVKLSAGALERAVRDFNRSNSAPAAGSTSKRKRNPQPAAPASNTIQ